MSRIPTTRRIELAVAAVLALALAAIPAIGVAKDRNHDNIPDRWERSHHLSLKVNQARRDQDDDALRNRGEFRADMDPRDDDSDGDGVEDGDEGAGTITAFDKETGELTIDLFGGKQVSGFVTDDTEIECENDDAQEPDDSTGRAARLPGPGESGDGGGDTSGPGGGGEDNSGPGPNSGPGSFDEAGEHDCDDGRCSLEDIAVGRVVREAELDLTADGLVFEEIELN